MQRQIIIFLTTVIPFLSAAADSIGSRPVNVDIEWVLQGKEIQFSGFFVEVMGISSALVTKFPQMRLTKSLFLSNESPSDPALTSNATLLKQLFHQEAVNLQALVSTTAASTIEHGADPLVFDDRPIQIPDDICKESNIEEHTSTQAAEHTSTTSLSSTTPPSTVERYTYADLAKPLVTGVVSKEKCCLQCLHEPLCLAWAFSQSGRQECRLKGRRMKLKQPQQLMTTAHTGDSHISSPKEDAMADDAIVFTSVVRQRAAIPAPRVLIFHGTACAYQNQTMSPYQKLEPFKRDGNTILVGRYMLERGADRTSFDAAEHQILHCAMLMDEVWVPSPWMADHLERISRQANMPMPEIVVIPEAIDTNLFRPQDVYSTDCSEGDMRPVVTEQDEGSVTEQNVCCSEKNCACVTVDVSSTGDPEQPYSLPAPFQFLSIFKWEHRKGWDVLLKAYWTTFQASDDVVLRLQTYNPATFVEEHGNISYNLERYAHELFEKPLSELARVTITDRISADAPVASDTLTRQQMRHLYAQSDAFILPTRGEGYGLPVAEAMAMRLPVIVTNHSGVTAYATEDNAYLIPVDYTTPNPYGYVEPDVESLIVLLRRVYQHPTERKAKGEAGRATIAAITPESVVNRMSARVRMLVGRRGWFDY